MTLENQLREQLDHATREVPAGPDLATSITTGRARRRRRTLAVTSAGIATAAVLATTAVLVVGDGPESSTPSVAGDPGGSETTSTRSSDPGDFVPGAERDEIMAAAIARHLPALPDPDDVYPSDFEHAGPMPDADHAEATDWQAAYTLGEDDSVLVFAGYSPPDQPPSAVCAPRGKNQVGRSSCQDHAVDGGSVLSDRYTTADGYVIYSTFVASSGFSTTVLETLDVDSWRAAEAARTLDGDLTDLLTDEDLRFPLPASRR